MRRWFILPIVAGLVVSGSMGAVAAPKFAPGATQSGDPYFPERGNGGYDAFSYAVTVELRNIEPGQPRTIKGTSIMTAKALQDLSRFSMDLVGLKVSKIHVNGKPAKFTREQTKLIITPKAGLAKGSIFLVHVDYSGTPQKVAGPGGRYFEGWLETDDGVTATGDPNNAALWMPVNDDLADKALFSVTARVPKGYFAFSNGKTIRDPKMVKGLMEFAWKANQPMAPHFVMLSVGKFDIVSGNALPGVWTVSGIDPNFNPALMPTAKSLIASMGEYLKFYESKFGKYPFDSAGAIFDRLDSSFSVDAQTRAYYPDGALNEDVAEEFFVHQLAHSWFGQSVSPARQRDIFLTEAFATYASWLWFEQKNALISKPGWADLAFNNIYKGADESFWSVNIADPGPTKLFDVAIYQRGAMALHVLRKTMGDDQFFAMLKAWTSAKKYQIATVEQFVDFAQSKSTKDLSLLFRDWLFTPTKPTRTSY